MRDAMTARRQTGLSLIELMVSITLGLIILSGVLVIFSNTSTARNEIERTTRQIENGRYASEVLTEDLRLAGFYGELDVGSVTAPASLPSDPCSVTATDWDSWIPIHLQGFDAAGFTSTNCTLTNLKANTDVLVVRRSRACLAGATNCDSLTTGKPYVQVSLCSSQVTNHRIGLEGTATFDMQAKDCATAAGKREYFARIYFIATDNGAGQSIPTLTRLELTGSGWTTVPLVEGIENLQLLYGIDSDSDGVPDVYVANPSDYPAGACTGTCPRSNWMNVVTVQFYLLARNLETSLNYVDTKTYTLGTDAAGSAITVGPLNDGYRRHVYSGLVRIANPAGRRDTP
jgi:type IV pilus assembly protein PilW